MVIMNMVWETLPLKLRHLGCLWIATSCISRGTSNNMHMSKMHFGILFFPLTLLTIIIHNFLYNYFVFLANGSEKKYFFKSQIFLWEVQTFSGLNCVWLVNTYFNRTWQLYMIWKQPHFLNVFVSGNHWHWFSGFSF